MMNEWIISSSLLIAGILVGRRLLRGRISLRLQYALWLAVLVRLLVPVQLFTSPIGAGSIAEDVDISAPVRQVYTAARNDDYQREYDAAYSQVVAEYEARNQTVAPDAIDKMAYNRVQQNRELDLTRLLYGAWFAGMAVMTSVIVSCNVHLGLHLRRRRWEFPTADSLLPVYVTEVVPTPCIFGFFHPAIYLTPEAAGDERVRRHALTHELTHYRHLDHIWSVLRSVCLVLHWYNPLVWMAARVSRADAELACDEGALAKLGEEHRADYGRTLIGLTCADHGGSVFVTATTMTGSARSIAERIKLLMKRPRNTVLALIAVVLIGSIIVGCTFAGAPETTEPTEPAETTEPTGHATDNDMSYREEDLPIAEIPAGIFNDEGVLVYPGVDWFMTEDEVMAALGITHVKFLEYQKSVGDDMTTTYFAVNLSDAFGVSMVLDFVFRSYWPNEEPVLTEVYGRFVHQEDFESVRGMYAHALGETDAKIAPGSEERWDGDVTFRDLLGKEGYEILNHCADAGAALDHPASHIQWGTGDSGAITWRTELPLPVDQAAEVAALFSEYADPAYRAALTHFYEYPAEKLEPFTMEELFVPEITEIVIELSDVATVYYRRPGDFQLYAAQVYYSEEDGWTVFSNRMVVSMEDYTHLNPRKLTAQEIAQFQSVFKTLNVSGEINPAACFLVSYYKDVTEMSRRDFMAYFPIVEDGSQKEFALLKEKYPEFFGDWTWETMPIPIHRYDPRELDNVLQTYANIRWEDLADDGTHYLEETGAYYNYTSDFGLGGFRAMYGFVCDGGAMICGDWSVLLFTEMDGQYTIQAHLPAIAAEG